MFRGLVFGALEGARKDCSLGEQFCWQTVLADAAPSPCRAPRRGLPVVCPGFGTDRSPIYQRDEKCYLFLADGQLNDAFLSLLQSFMQLGQR